MIPLSLRSRLLATVLGLSLSIAARADAQPAAATGSPAPAGPSWPTPRRTAAGAPNIVLILIDDVGFGATATFGGPIATPEFTALARNGLEYNNFHVNSLCSPSRASLLTGRNNHQVGFGSIAEAAAPEPGYDTRLPADVTPLAAVLRDNGYSTAASGKWHNTPYWQVSPAGPFDLWPTGRWGFDHFYGFMKAADNQYFPRLYRDTSPVEPPSTPAQGYHFTNDMTNQAIDWVRQHDAVAHDKPFFIYFATGATHEPHQVPKQWIERYKGQFDKGWDAIRAEAFARQKRLGIIPADAELTPRPDGLPAWDSLSAEQHRLLAHEAEVYAGFTEQTDHEVGRLLNAIRQQGQADNTIVLEIFGDNGASAEGGLEGHDARDALAHPLQLDQRVAALDSFGSEMYMNHYAAAWAWALSSPFKGTKQDSSHLGGTTDPLVVSWPGHIHAVGGVRGQFSHLNDIAPTLYELAGITPPAHATDGTAELPLEGKSLVYSFEHPEAPSRHTEQYFAMSGNRGIYADGWWAGDLSANTWDKQWPVYLGPGQLPHSHPWELYDLNHDYSQAHDLAAANPAKLHALQALFEREAQRNGVVPLNPHPVPYPVGPAGGQRVFAYRPGDERIAPLFGPDFGHHAYRLTAHVTIPAGGADGVVFADGGRYGGLSLSVQDGHAVLEVNSFGNIEARIASSVRLAPGQRNITVQLTPTGAPLPSPGTLKLRSGTASLAVDGDTAQTASLPNAVVVQGESLDIGADLGTPVGPDYQTPARFTGAIDTVVIEQTD